MLKSKDRFGYYKVNGFKTYSKVEAIELHRLTGHHPHWYFNEEIFSSYDWTQEPPASLESLYYKRALQIRHNYDYVVLCYSGGADSSNIRETFVRNKIPFDEILTFNYHALDPRTNNYFHAEQFAVSYPKIEQLQNQGIKFQHRSFDLSHLAFEILTTDKLESDIAYYQNHSYGASHYARQRIRESDPNMRRIIDSGKSVVFVWGLEKPKLSIEQQRYCIRFQDMVDTCISTRSRVLGYEWEHDELFYWDPDCCDLMCKQAHTIMHFLKQNSFALSSKSAINGVSHQGDNMQISYDKILDKGLTLRQILDALIYPHWDPFTFSMGKSHQPVISLRDEAWYKDKVLSQKLSRCVQHLSSLDPYWHNIPGDISKGLKQQISPPYFLE